jgi:DNA-binding NarL/FixJ family response regulator
MDAPRKNGSTAGRRRVVVADGDPLARRVLRDTLELGGLSVIADTATARETIELTLHYGPDLLVMDLHLPDGDALDVIRRVVRSAAGTLIVVVSATDEDDAAIAALRLGAAGFLSKAAELSALPRTLRAVLDGELGISRRLARVLVDRVRATPDGQVGLRPVLSPLTDREWEVLDLLCSDKSTGEIAATLFLSIETIRSHVKSILRKTRTNSRAEVVALAPRLRVPAAAAWHDAGLLGDHR